MQLSAIDSIALPASISRRPIEEANDLPGDLAARAGRFHLHAAVQVASRTLARCRFRRNRSAWPAASRRMRSGRARATPALLVQLNIRKRDPGRSPRTVVRNDLANSLTASAAEIFRQSSPSMPAAKIYASSRIIFATSHRIFISCSEPHRAASERVAIWRSDIRFPCSGAILATGASWRRSLLASYPMRG